MLDNGPTKWIAVHTQLYVNGSSEHWIKFDSVTSCRLPSRQSRQLPKARHGVEACKLDFSDIISEFVKRKVRKMF